MFFGLLILELNKIKVAFFILIVYGKELRDTMLNYDAITATSFLNY